MTYEYVWFMQPWMWMPFRWRRLSILPWVNDFARDTEEYRGGPCQKCLVFTTLICPGWYGYLCSYQCWREMNWEYSVACAGRRRFLQPAYYRSLWQRYVHDEW